MERLGGIGGGGLLGRLGGLIGGGAADVGGGGKAGGLLGGLFKDVFEGGGAQKDAGGGGAQKAGGGGGGFLKGLMGLLGKAPDFLNKIMPLIQQFAGLFGGGK